MVAFQFDSKSWYFVKVKIDFEMWKLNPLNETQLQILQRWVLATCGKQINKMFVFAFLFDTQVSRKNNKWFSVSGAKVWVIENFKITKAKVLNICITYHFVLCSSMSSFLNFSDICAAWRGVGGDHK